MTVIESLYGTKWEVEKYGDDYVRLKGRKDGFSRLFRTKHLLDVLRTEGLLPEDKADDGLRERLEKKLKKWEEFGPNNTLSLGTAVESLKRVLDPEPEFVFPTGLGAVIEGVDTGTPEPVRLVRTQVHDGYAWTTVGLGIRSSEAELLSYLKDLKVLSTGLAE